MDNALRTRQLNTGYGSRIVVSGVEIDINIGEIVCLIGPNGAGKSTVLKTLAGQLEPLGGSIYIAGKEAGSFTHNEISKYRAVMLTERISSEQMNCEEVVSLGRYPYTGRLGILTEEDKSIVRQSMELVHVTEIAGRDFREISDGQRQRVLLARAICQEPKLMILDEPTSYLDIRHKMEFLDLLKKLVRERGIAVIMSMHELELAHMTADRIICIDAEGNVRMTGTPEEVFRGEEISNLYGVDRDILINLYGSFTKTLINR